MRTTGKPEGVIETYLTKQAKKFGYLCRKFVTPGVRGSPDRILIGYEHVRFVECKAPNGVLRKQQQKRIQEMRQYGAEVYVCPTKESVDQLFEKLNQIDNIASGNEVTS